MQFASLLSKADRKKLAILKTDLEAKRILNILKEKRKKNNFRSVQK